MHTLLSVCLVLLLAFPSLASAAAEAICSNAAVIFCENFEDRALGSGDMATTGTKNAGWGNTALTRITIVNTQAYDGSKAVQFEYPAGTGGIGWLESFFASNTTLYARWYTKWSSNYKWSFVSTKHHEWTLNNGHTDHNYIQHSPSPTQTSPGNPRMSYGWVTPFFGGNWNTGSQILINFDTWYCFEVRTTLNSATGVSDGYLQGWINGVQQQEYPNVQLETTGEVINGIYMSGYWNCYGSTGNGADCGDATKDQHPLMYRWHDNLVVSTSRIGCLDSPPSAPVLTNPRQPINLRRAEVENFVELRDGDDYVTRVSR